MNTDTWSFDISININQIYYDISSSTSSNVIEDELILDVMVRLPNSSVSK